MRVFNDPVQQIPLESPALRRGDRPISHDDQRDDRSSALKRQLDMAIRLRLQPIALVKGLAAAGERVLRRLDLEDERLLPLQQLPEDPARVLYDRQLVADFYQI